MLMLIVNGPLRVKYCSFCWHFLTGKEMEIFHLRLQDKNQCEKLRFLPTKFCVSVLQHLLHNVNAHITLCHCLNAQTSRQTMNRNIYLIQNIHILNTLPTEVVNERNQQLVADPGFLGGGTPILGVCANLLFGNFLPKIA